MSWFQSTNIASLAKTALKEAQKTIDKALDISEAEEGARNEGGRNSSAAVSSAVTDMASEFFASWGVGGGGGLTSSSSSSSLPSTSVDGSSSSLVNNSAISSPPTRTSAVILGGENEIIGATNELSITSDVPVTLLVSSSSALSEPSSKSEQSQSQVLESVSSSGRGHNRSLSDTVFHAPDDANSLGDLVQILDDSSVSLDTNKKQAATLHFSHPAPIPIAMPVSSTFRNKEENIATLIDSSEIGVSSNDTTTLENKPVNEDGKENVELLQEIDLEGGNGELEQPEQNVIITSTSTYNANVESSLSDGWDWTSATESCLITADEGQRTEERPVKVEVAAPQEGSASNESSHTASTIEPEPVTSLEKTADEKMEEVESTTEDPAVPPDSDSSSHFKHISSPSSRPSSSVCQEQSEERGSTPPSSARVSPNFEIVTSSGAPHPESSRSSSIVVVSGRGSTQNSRGTSGAGSSGSSEGGHDIADVEIPQSPAAAACSPTEDFRRVSKHKKGASSSSSDIEVIPSDYASSSSPSALHNPALRSEQKSVDVAIQTESSVELKECEVQTEGDEDNAAKNPCIDQNQLSTLVSAEVADILAEKEQEAQQLREEGEKLSKKQFELGQVIKKLRAKEKETESAMKGLRAEVATKNLELEKLMKTFISKEGIEQSQNDTISKLNQDRRRLELRQEQLNSELEDAKDNVESMKATVENASIEILELKNVISSVQRESAEVDRLTRDKAELISRTESLQKEVDHLRTVLNSSQSSHHSREAELKSQISLLTQKIHGLENRLADISSEVADATMPLSMEIEKLQGELKQQLLQSDRREHSLQSTISDLERKLTAATEREKSAKDLQIQYQSDHSTLELRISELEAQNRTLTEQVHQKEEIYVKKLDDKTSRLQKLEKTVERLTGEVERLTNENEALSSELDTERTSLEAERRRSQSLMESGRENNNFNHAQSNPRQQAVHHQRSSSMSTTASSTGGNTLRSATVRNHNSPRSRENSPSEHSITSEEASYLDEVFDPNTGMMIGGGNLNNRSMTPKSFFESFSSAGLIENLQAQLRHREGEVLAFQEELSKNEKIRKQLNEEIANLTMHNQQLAIDMERMGEMQQKLDELDKNYNAVLQMYGEKVEEADELRMDLEDVKEMYKNQIEQLLKKS